MTWFYATGMLAAAGAFVFWPLIRHLQSRPPGPAVEAPDQALLRLEEIDLDHAAGRLSDAEAAALRRELLE